MHLQAKSLLFAAVYLGGGSAALTAAFKLGGSDAVVLVGILWFVLFGIGQFFVLRCPHCRNVTTITPSGWAVPFAGRSCRYCGRIY